jgi:serine/threonine protein kinase
VAGTISYLPPEAVNAMTLKEKYCTEASDSWALGLIIFIMLQFVLLHDPDVTRLTSFA